MTASSVADRHRADPSLFNGAISSLDGTQIGARVTSADGHDAALDIALRSTPAGSARSGTLDVNPVQ